MSQEKCSSCPADTVRLKLNQDQRYEIDVELAKLMFSEDPTFTFNATEHSTEILADKDVPEVSHDRVYLCARQRFMGLCSMGVVEVRINNEFI